MIVLRPSDARGRFDHGWLDTRHTFSFGHYRDPAWDRFGNLRVLNEDRVAPGQGFGLHPHRDMEIVTIVLSGTLRHRDSLGHSADLSPGELQRISAGRGVSHSEVNPSTTEPVHFLQIWIEPAALGADPGYEQRAFDPALIRDRLALLASSTGGDGTISLGQDARIWRGVLGPDRAASVELRQGKRAWVHVIRGAAKLNGHLLGAGDAAGVTDEPRLTVTAGPTAEADVVVLEVP